MQPKYTLDELAKQRIEAKGKLEELEERHKAEREPYQQAIQAINESLLKEMTKAKQFTVGYEGFTISRKKSTKAVVTNDAIALADAKEKRPEYILETLAPQALKDIEKGSLALEGVTVETREYISIRQAKSEQPNAA